MSSIGYVEIRQQNIGLNSFVEPSIATNTPITEPWLDSTTKTKNLLHPLFTADDFGKTLSKVATDDNISNLHSFVNTVDQQLIQIPVTGSASWQEAICHAASKQKLMNATFLIQTIVKKQIQLKAIGPNSWDEFFLAWQLGSSSTEQSVSGSSKPENCLFKEMSDDLGKAVANNDILSVFYIVSMILKKKIQIPATESGSWGGILCQAALKNRLYIFTFLALTIIQNQIQLKATGQQSWGEALCWSAMHSEECPQNQEKEKLAQVKFLAKLILENKIDIKNGWWEVSFLAAMHGHLSILQFLAKFIKKHHISLTGVDNYDQAISAIKETQRQEVSTIFTDLIQKTKHLIDSTDKKMVKETKDERVDKKSSEMSDVTTRLLSSID